MSEYRKIYYPKCPYCKTEANTNGWHDGSNNTYGKLVSMAIGSGTDDVILTCPKCNNRYRVVCSTRFNSRKLKSEKG